VAPFNTNYSRNPNPLGSSNPEMSQMIDSNPVFSAIAQEVEQERTAQSMKQTFIYNVNGSVRGQETGVFTLLVEQGVNFKCLAISGSCFSYDAVNPTDYPLPNALGVTDWAGRGLSFQITDTRTGNLLTSGFVPAELLLTPGYGFSMIRPIDFRYFFFPNTKMRFDVRNRDNVNRVHEFNLALIGYKIYTPA
jgi:hypothetical protein